ncbi:MAG TPA: HAMP domain-containing sensor histidine kinase, partial [Polyangiaceae bacterium]|nr:HAMP domain-containing sensor histidine kinase [Polyangiaceae bacterium]
HSYGDDLVRLRAFASERFAAVWSDDAARRELASSVARTFDVGVTLRNSDHAALFTTGDCSAADVVLPVARNGAEVGQVDVCLRQTRGKHRAPVFLAIVAASLTLWGASSMVARRLGRPLAELARVASEVGSGRLSSRSKLGRHQPGEFGMLADAIDDMAARIEQQLADQRELVAAVSHEIRAPLSRLRVLVEILRGQGANDATLVKFEREIVEIDALVGDLLASARLDFSLLRFTALDAGLTAAEALERAGLPHERLVVRTSDLAFDGDATLLARALANLLDNASRHGGGATSVVVRDGNPGSLVFEVEDRGPGFPAEVLPRAFEPFQRGHVERRGATSLGLGLALVRRIAEAHGGSTWAENRPDGGARVAMSLVRRHPTDVSSACIF